MQIPVMTFNIQHGVDYKRKDHAAAQKFLEMDPEYLEKLKWQPPKAEDPNLIDLSLTAEAIRRCGAEIISLNEVRDTAEGWSDPCFTDQVRTIAESLGFPYFYFGRAIDVEGKGLYGNGLISKYPIRHVETIAIPDPLVKDEPTWYESRCMIRAEIDVTDAASGEAKPLTVLVTHMGLAKGEARNAVQTALEQVVPGAATLLMGDFNLTPDSEILAPLLTKYQDAGALLPEGTLSFPSDVPDCKIDYIMAAGPVKFLQAEIPALVVSDHRPHTAVIEL